MKKYMKDTLPILVAMAILIAFAVFDFFKCYAAAPVPMERILRNGLTDAQVTQILATDPNATIHLNGSTWRNISFNTDRYNNVTNWLAVIGETNDFARLVVPLSHTNAVLTAENTALKAKITSEIAFLEQMKTLCDKMAEKYPAQREEIMAVKAQIQSRINALQS